MNTVCLGLVLMEQTLDGDKEYNLPDERDDKEEGLAIQCLISRLMMNNRF